MSTARVHYVKAAQQRYVKVAKLDEEGKQVLTPVQRKSGAPRLRKSGTQVVKRIKVADKSQPLPPRKCGKCGNELSVGKPYRWFTVGFRGYPQFRCMNATCTPTVVELESSQMGEVYGALETARSAIGSIDATDRDDAETQINDIFSELVSTMEEVKDAYREADEHFGGGGMTDSGERADQLESAISELESFSLSVSDPDGCGDAFKEDLSLEADEDAPEDHDTPVEGCSHCDDAVETWRTDEVIPAVEDALDNLELP